MDVVSDDRVVRGLAGDSVLRQIEAQGPGSGLLVDDCATSLEGAIREGEKGADWGRAVKRVSTKSLCVLRLIEGDLVVGLRSPASSSQCRVQRTDSYRVGHPAVD